MTPSVAGTIFGALEYLTSFPYGCTEQTMSSFLPNVIVSQALKELQLKSKIDPAALEKKVKAGLDRLYDFQHEDGGWGWWKTDESHIFMTAYVVAGLTQAAAAGYDVQRDSIAKGAGWLRAQLASAKEFPPDSRAYAVYALVQSGSNQPALVDAAWSQRSKMSAYGIALLGLAFAAASDARAAEAAATLESQVVSDDREASWPVQQDAMLDFSGDVTPEATAYAVKFLTQVRSGESAAAEGRAVAGESSRPGLLLDVHQADGDGRLRAHRISQSQRRAAPQLFGHDVGEWQAGVVDALHRGRRAFAERAGDPA